MDQPTGKYSPKLEEFVRKLQEKYQSSGEDVEGYFEGLYYTSYLTYWDYINLDTLLTLQQPRTEQPDELVFIAYHQITELYFKLILWEIKQIAFEQNLTVEFFREHMGRVNRYVNILIYSFQVMRYGMDQEQFLKFRMALIPASGFQSVQYRLIEIESTEFYNLIWGENLAAKGITPDSPIEEMYPYMYWKYGATEKNTGRKTITLSEFEKKYNAKLIRNGKRYADKNLAIRCKPFLEDNKLVEQLRYYDLAFNVRWQLTHLTNASHYLSDPEEDQDQVESTGGTNWEQYLPPQFQKRFFFPFLWSEEEKAAWGTFTELNKAPGR